MQGGQWDAVPHVRLAVLALALAAVPLASGDNLTDPDGDAEGGLDAIEVAWILGNATATVEVRFAPGDMPADRAVRGVLLVGEPGAAEPSEWYQFTIANETHVFVGHQGPRDATLVATSWTGDVARVELQREAPASASCAFAVVEAGTMTEQGFTRSDVAPSGFDSPEKAWPVDACPEPRTQAAATDDEEEKATPGPAWLGLLGSVALALFVRRRAH